MTLLASKCVDGAAQRALSLAKCVNKVARWGFTWSKSLLAGCGSSHHSALLELRRQGEESDKSDLAESDVGLTVGTKRYHWTDGCH